MADLRPWYKLWVSCLTDPDLQNLTLEDWARWVRLGVFMKAHGTNGTLIVKAPFTSLLNLLHVTDPVTLMCKLGLLPNVKTRNDSEMLQITIEFDNWHKYQVDSSAARVRKHRAKSNGRRREVEEKRITTPFLGTSKADLAGPYGG
jgi:hypothetical protein